MRKHGGASRYCPCSFSSTQCTVLHHHVLAPDVAASQHWSCKGDRDEATQAGTSQTPLQMSSASGVVSVLVIASMHVAPPACAQAPAAQLPAPLVGALMAGVRGETPSQGAYYVGALPPGWPTALTAAGSATVVGGMSASGQLVAIFADTTRRFLAAYIAQLESAGWKEPEPPDFGGFRQASPASRGFQSSGYQGGQLCRDSAGVAARPVPGAERGAFVHVMYRRIDPGCQRTHFPPVHDASLELPALRAPQSARGAAGGGSSSGGSSINAATRFTDTTLSASQVVAHYSAQLVAAGWTASDSASHERIASQAFDARDKDDHPWSGAITVIATAGLREVSLLMTRKDAQ